MLTENRFSEYIKIEKCLMNSVSNQKNQYDKNIFSNLCHANDIELFGREVKDVQEFIICGYNHKIN